jgi:hypothetical protein
VHTAVYIQQDSNRSVGKELHDGGGECANRVGIVGDGSELCGGKGPNQFDEPEDIGADQRVGDQNIRARPPPQSSPLRDGGALEAGDALSHLQTNDLRYLVGLDMRSEALHRADKRDHAPGILLNAVG